MKREVIETLEFLGLNKYERSLWLALLSRGASTAGELANISGVPRSRCYDVLQTLANKGFLIIQPGKPIRYIPASPEIVLERVKFSIEKKTREMVERIDKLKDSEVMEELKKLEKKNMDVTSLENIMGALKGKYALLAQLNLILKNSSSYVKLITTEEGLKDIVENSLTEIKNASKRGVKIQIAAPARNKDVVDRLSKHAELRNIEDVEHVEKMLGRVFTRRLLSG
jgi:sugar-specific transcriptional regulator TrmB